MTRRTVGVSRIAIKGLHSGSTEALMRKPRRHGRHFAAGRKVVGKSWRAAEQTASGKGEREAALVPEAEPAASESAGDQESEEVWETEEERESGVAWETEEERESGVA